MKKKYKDLTKNIGLFTISSFGTKIISFLLVPLYTLYLSTGDYGTMDLITTTVSLLIPVFTLNIQDAILRFSLDDNYKKIDVLNQGIRINIIASTIFAICILIASLIGILKLSSLYILFMYISFSCGAINNALQMYFKAEDKVKILVVSSIMQTLILCLGNIILLVVFKMGIDGYLLSMIIGNLIPIIFMISVGGIFKNNSVKENRELMKAMIHYSFPLVFNSISWWINNASDRYILTYMSGVAENGLYSVAYKVPTILSTIQSIFYNAWSISAITEFDKDDTDGFLGNTYSMFSFASVVSCSVIILFNIPISRFLYSNDFFEAWRFVPFLLVGTTFNGLALFEGCIFSALKKTKQISSTTVIGAIVNTIFNFILIYYFSALGAAAATLIGYITTWIMRTIILRRYVKIKVNWNIQFCSYLLLIIQSFLALDIYFLFVQCFILMLIILLNYKIALKVIKGIKNKIISTKRVENIN